VRYVFVPAREVSKGGRIRLSIKMVAGAVFVAALINAGPAVYRDVLTHPYFQIKEVRFSGLENVSREELLSLIRPLFNGSILTCDIKSAARFIRTNPWIDDVSIRRRLPDILQINVVERVPAAVLQTGPDRFFLIDRRGFLLDEAAGETGQFVITGLSVWNTGAAELRPGSRIENDRLDDAFRINEIFLNDSLFNDHAAAVDVSDIDRITVRTKLTGSVIHFGPAKNRWNEKFLEYLVVRRILEETGESFTGMDLSFKDQVVVSLGANGLKEYKKTFIKG
jgi:hypothetical protein